MLKITDVELKRAYRNGDYIRYFFQTTLEMQIGERYNRTKLTLTDEQTERVVRTILAIASEGLAMELEKPEPVEDEPPITLAALSTQHLDEVAL